MRVITGSAKGKRLETLKGNDVRPTSDRVKEAVFSIIQFELQGKKFLDLFSGSGQMGIEALSRGASEAVFVDSKKESIEVIKRNLDSVGLAFNAKVLNYDVCSYLSKTSEFFDIVFLDPPYYSGEIQKVLPMIIPRINGDGTIICENPLDEGLPEKVKDFVLLKTYKHGKIKLNVYRRESGE